MSRGVKDGASAAFRAVVERSYPATEERGALAVRSTFGLYQTVGAARSAVTREGHVSRREAERGVTVRGWVESSPLVWAPVD